MLEKEFYANGQRQFELNGDLLTYFYKDGKIRAVGNYSNGSMNGEWKFYRATGQFWQSGNFKDGKKHGLFTRYDRNDKVEYQENFIDDKQIKRK